MPEQQKEAEGGDERGGESGGQIVAAASFLALPVLLCKSPEAGSGVFSAFVLVVEEVGLARRGRQAGVRGLVDASAASRCH